MTIIRSKIFVMLLSLMMSLSFAPRANAELSPRIKALLLMSTYGAVGGTLLGTAALAFDARGRSPFIGASLGLYAGILFGSYVVISHTVKTKWKNNGDYPDSPASPYENVIDSDAYYYDKSPEGVSGNQESLDAPSAQMWNPYWINEYANQRNHFSFSNKIETRPPIFYLNFLNYQF